jgi:hypothetical protein
MHLEVYKIRAEKRASYSQKSRGAHSKSDAPLAKMEFRDIISYTGNMPERLQAMIKAKGGHIPY